MPKEPLNTACIIKCMPKEPLNTATKKANYRLKQKFGFIKQVDKG